VLLCNEVEHYWPMKHFQHSTLLFRGVQIFTHGHNFWRFPLGFMLGCLKNLRNMECTRICNEELVIGRLHQKC